MPGIQKTTVYLDADDYRALKGIARDRGEAPAALVREAVSEFAARHARRRKPKGVGAFRSGGKALSERAEELLAGFGQR